MDKVALEDNLTSRVSSELQTVPCNTYFKSIIVARHRSETQGVLLRSLVLRADVSMVGAMRRYDVPIPGRDIPRLHPSDRQQYAQSSWLPRNRP